MRFAALVASLTAGASVTVAAGNANSQRIIADLNSAAEASMLELQSQACDLSACIAAYAPTLVACAAAIAEPTPFGEAACIAAIIATGSNPPASCDGCL